MPGMFHPPPPLHMLFCSISYLLATSLICRFMHVLNARARTALLSPAVSPTCPEIWAESGPLISTCYASEFVDVGPLDNHLASGTGGKSPRSFTAGILEGAGILQP